MTDLISTSAIAWAVALILIGALVFIRFSGRNGSRTYRPAKGASAPDAESDEKVGTLKIVTATPTPAPSPLLRLTSRRGGGGVAIFWVIIIGLILWLIVIPLYQSGMLGDTWTTITSRPSGNATSKSGACTQPARTVTAPADGSWSNTVDVMNNCYALVDPGPSSDIYRMQCRKEDGSYANWDAVTCATLTGLRFKKTDSGTRPVRIEVSLAPYGEYANP